MPLGAKQNIVNYIHYLLHYLFALHCTNVAFILSVSCILFWLCAALVEMFGFLHPTGYFFPLSPQDHADSAELRCPAAS